MTIEKVLETHQQRLMDTPGVVGVGVGGSEETPVIVVMVTDAATAMAKKLPRQLDGYPVKVETTGEITAL